MEEHEQFTRTPRNVADDDSGPVRLGSQTLFRGLDVIEVVAEGPIALGELADRLGLTRSTTQPARFRPRGSALSHVRSAHPATAGPKLLELATRFATSSIFRARLPASRAAGADHGGHGPSGRAGSRARPVPRQDSGQAAHLHQLPHRRVAARVVDGLGKALILDHARKRGRVSSAPRKHPAHQISQAEWVARMRSYAQAGCAFDLEENEDQIRCVAAPIRTGHRPPSSPAIQRLHASGSHHVFASTPAALSFSTARAGNQ